MISKQDGVSPRTPSELERKYNFGKSFAEIMGYASDAQKAAEIAKEAADKATEAYEGLDQEAIFNLLTDNGKAQGVYRGEDGQIYTNASYLRSGVITSADGTIRIDLSKGAALPVFNTGISTNGVIVRGDVAGAEEVFSARARTSESQDEPYFDMQVKSATDKALIARLCEYFTTDGTQSDGVVFLLRTADKKHEIRLTVNSGAAALRFFGDEEEIANLRLGLKPNGSPGVALDGVSQINGKWVSWKDNGDGTSTLIGTD